MGERGKGITSSWGEMIMGFRCVGPSGESIQSFDLDDVAWTSLLGENRRARHLRMACCDTQVVLRNSRRGLRYFAHKARGECTTAPETEEHLLLKKACVDAAIRAGWECATEFREAPPEGGSWKADVLASRGGARMALECQWSPQTEEVTVYRQERYRQAGVRGLWLFRQQNFPSSKAVPAVQVVGDLENGFFVLGLAGGEALPPSPPQRLQRLGMPLGDFLDVVFAERFKFGIPDGTAARVTIETGIQDCWNCGAETRIVIFIKVRFGSHEQEFYLDAFEDFADLVDQLAAQIPISAEVGAIKRRYSRTMDETYLSNGCAHCDALLGKHFVLDALDLQSRTFEFDVALDHRWREFLTQGGSEFGWGIYPPASTSAPPGATIRRPGQVE